eukprot:m.153224 g.153224  ORF g.153224 m.153224 type:complete len:721 (+) comp16935_c5_seq1:88-2250(+)
MSSSASAAGLSPSRGTSTESLSVPAAHFGGADHNIYIDEIDEDEARFLSNTSAGGSRRSSFLFDEDDHFGGKQARGSNASATLTQLLNDTVTPFHKILLLLSSLRDDLPEDPNASQESAPLTETEDRVTLQSTPRERLNWCLKHLEEYAGRKLMTTSTHEALKRLLLEKLGKMAVRGKSDEVVARWVQATYTEDNHPVRHRSESSPKPERSHSVLPLPDIKPTTRRRFVASEGDIIGLSDDSAFRRSESLPTPVAGQRKSTPLAKLNESMVSALEQVKAVQQLLQRKMSDDSDVTTRRSRLFSAPSLSPRMERPSVTVPQPEFSKECTLYLENMHQWGFDVCRLTTLADQRPLTAIVMTALQRCGSISKLHLDQATLLRYFIAVEDGYARHDTVPYHNNEHAADVVQSTYCLMQTPNVRQAMSDLEVFAAIVAAAVHDVGHAGVNNQFLIMTQDPLSVLYNDQSVLENHHAATAFRIMNSENMNILDALDVEDRAAVRSMVIEMVLSTDMAKHFQFLSDFRTLVENKRQLSLPSHTVDLRESSDEDRILLLCAIVHCADLGPPAKPWPLCRTWTERIIAEFFAQGDRESELGLDIGPLNDRHKISMPKSQTGFIDFVVLPLWETWDTLVGRNSIQIQLLSENRDNWQALLDAETLAMKHAAADEHGEGALGSSAGPSPNGRATNSSAGASPIPKTSITLAAADSQTANNNSSFMGDSDEA